MVKRKTSLFNQPFVWLQKWSSQEAKIDNLLGRERANLARFTPLKRDEERQRKEAARGVKIAAAYRTRQAKRRGKGDWYGQKPYTRSELRQQYKRDIGGAGLSKRGLWPTSFVRAMGLSKMERKQKKRRKPKR